MPPLNMSSRVAWDVPHGTTVRFLARPKSHPNWTHPVDGVLARQPLMLGVPRAAPSLKTSFRSRSLARSEIFIPFFSTGAASEPRVRSLQTRAIAVCAYSQPTLWRPTQALAKARRLPARKRKCHSTLASAICWTRGRGCSTMMTFGRRGSRCPGFERPSEAPHRSKEGQGSSTCCSQWWS